MLVTYLLNDIGFSFYAPNLVYRTIARTNEVRAEMKTTLHANQEV